MIVLNSNEQLLRALETKQYGRPLALGTVIREALAANDLIPLTTFLTAKENIYSRHWSIWSLASWTMKQLGVSDYLRSNALPSGQYIVLSNLEDIGKSFSEKNPVTDQSRFERTFSKAHFHKTFNTTLVASRQLSEQDTDILLRFLSRDKGVLLYDGSTVKIKAPGESDTLTEEDASIAQLKELLVYLTHQTSLLSARVDELTLTAKDAVSKKNRVAALAALKSKKLAETTLEKRFATVTQLEEVAHKIQQAADNVAMVKVMEASGEALKSLNAQVGGAERVEEVVDRLREQMSAADEVNSILAESGAVIDEGEIDDELEALEGEEKRKVEEKERKEKEEERKRLEAQQEKEAEELKKRLEEAGKVPVEETKEAEEMMSRMSLEDGERIAAE